MFLQLIVYNCIHYYVATKRTRTRTGKYNIAETLKRIIYYVVHHTAAKFDRLYDGVGGMGFGIMQCVDELVSLLYI